MAVDSMVDSSLPFSWFDYTTWGNNSSPFVKAGNTLFYGSMPNPPVPVPGAPQTIQEMTSGSFTPQDSVNRMWFDYQNNVETWLDKIPDNKLPDTNWVPYAIVGGFAVYWLFLRK